MRQFVITLMLVWTAASAAAYVYSQQQSIPRPLLFALLPAFLIEIGLYLIPGFEKVRRRFDRLGSNSLRAALLTAGAIAPYLIESLRLGTFRLVPFLLLLTLTSIAAFWYALMKPAAAVDLLFMVFMAAVFLSKAFTEIYLRPLPHLQLEILGKLMWIRLGVMAVLSLRRIENIRFGFLPNPKEWRIGIEQFCYFIPVGAAASYVLRFARFHPLALVWWKFMLFVPAIFFGVLWVTALAEEFFFRGLLLQIASRGFHSDIAGLIVSSILFGSAHLLFHSFPNWRFAIIAGIAGVFYGIAFLKTRSVRAGMVTHALVVTAWRSLFSG